MSSRSNAPDLEAEQEVDLGRYARAVLVRWWLPVAGLVAGVVVGYLISLGGSQVWKASASVYLGQPYSIIGSVALQAKQTNPSAVGTVVHSETAIDAAAAAAGMPPGQLRGGISTQTVSSGTGSVGTTRIQQNPIVRVTVQAPTRRKAGVAANALAEQVVTALSAYGRDKITLLQQRVSSDQKEVDAIRGALGGADKTTAAVFAVQLSTVLQDQLQAEQLLAQAKDVELPSVLIRATAVRTTARSRRNDVVVAAFLGLVIGLIAALAWDPVAARRRA